MNVLFVADPNSIHDIKWISYFTSKNMLRGFLLPRRRHWPDSAREVPDLKADILGVIDDFSIRRFLRTISTAARIRRFVKGYAIDIINVHYAEPNALWCLFRWYFGVPIIITALGTDVLVTIPQAFKRMTFIDYLVAPAYRRAFRLADWVTATSGMQVNSVMKFSGRKNEISVIRTGVDRERLLSETSDSFPLKDDTPFILFPRYMRPVYNHEFSLEAISLLPDDVKAKCKMVFVGKGTGDRQYQKKLEDQMRAQTQVTFEFLEKQDQEALFELYKRAEAVVMCPLSDGSPVSGMEALLCGAKLILGPLNYDTDIFSQAIRMKTWNAAELASLITQALDDPARPQLSAETVAAMDRETNMQKMMEIYKSLIEPKGAT